LWNVITNEVLGKMNRAFGGCWLKDRAVTQETKIADSETPSAHERRDCGAEEERAMFDSWRCSLR